jgi:phage-related protein
MPPQVTQLVNSPGVGDLLPPPVRRRLEQSFDLDLGLVRVHTDPRAAAAAASLGARAFTYGLHIFLGSGESPADLALMAHEVSHVIQQQGAPVFQMYSAAGSDRFEHEAEQASTQAQRGESASVQERTGGARVQKQGLLERGAAWLRDQVMSLLEDHAPELVPILRQGVIEWLKERLGAAVQAMMDEMARPVRTIGDLVAAVRRHFTNLVGWLREAGAKIARNDCSPISEAADKIHQVFEGLTAPVVERIKHYADTVKQFFRGLWDRFGAPVWNLLQRIGGAIWEQIQRIGRWIWEKTKPIRDWLSRAWRWFKNWLGIGEGEEGQNGILQWFQRKASEAWEWVSARLAPYKRQILIVVGILVMLSPAGPIIAIGAAAAGILRGIQWVRQHLRNRGSVVQQRSILRGVILPAILGAISRVSGIVHGIASAITGALTRVVNALTEMAATVASIPILSLASGLVNFLVDAFRGLLQWAIEGVQGLANWLDGGLQRLGGFANQLVDFLERVGTAIGNVMRLGYALGGRVWNAIPACIRDPFIDFFIPLILRQISFFSELVATPEAWQQTRTEVMRLIRQVFRDFDLMGAIKSVFRLVVRALRIPVDLAAQVLEKGAQAWDLVMAAPLRFIENALKAILRGIGRFMGNFLSHLWYGVQGWLLNAVQQSGTGIRPPASWDFRGIFSFVLDVLGISLDHVLDLLARRVGRPVVDRIRRAINFLTGVWEWVKVAIEEGPAGLWRMVVDRLGNLAQMVLESAVGWVMTRIIAIVSARLTALAASAGLSGVLEAVVAVYQAVRTAMEYARRILEIMLLVFNTVVQIAQGVIDPASEMVERGLRMAMPIVIGFLANYAGLGGIGGRIREIILDVRERVDNAILALIDRALAAGRWLLDRLRAGVQAITDWWRLRKAVRTGTERHMMFFVGEGRSAVLTIESTRKTLRDYINVDVKPKVPATHPKFGNISLIETSVSEIERIKNDTSYGQAAGSAINKELGDIARWLEELGDTVPQTVIVTKSHKTLADGSVVGEEVLVQPLTRKPPTDYAGSAPYQTNPTWLAVNQRVNKYIRGHLLNHHLYGPGKNENMAPITRPMNTGIMSSQLEEPTKEAVFGRNAIVRYHVKMHYGTHPYPSRRIAKELYLPTSVEMSSKIIESTASGWKDKSKIYEKTEIHTLPSDNDPIGAVPKLHRLAINNPSAGPTDPNALQALLKLDQIGESRANLILSRLSSGSFRSWDEVETTVSRADIVGRWKVQKSEADGTTRLVWFNGVTEWRV